MSMDDCSTWINMINNNPLILLLYFISLFSLLFNIYQSRKLIAITEKLNRKSMKKIKIMSELIPIKPYRMFRINETTPPMEIEELILEAKRTHTITVFPFDDINYEMQYLQMELVQKSLSIVIHIELFTGHNIILPEIDDLLLTVFHPSKLIRIWGPLDRYQYEHQIYPMYRANRPLQCRFVNIQNDFKIWYNNTFIHNEDCGQILDFHNIDGPLCSCSHRPYKHQDDQWSLRHAIAYTFHEILDDSSLHLRTCQAITKLATIIDEKWDYDKLRNYLISVHRN